MVRNNIVEPDRISRIREVYNYSQTKLGKLINLPKQSVSRIEKGKRAVSEEEIIIIADHFKLPVQAFYEDGWDFNLFQFITTGPDDKSFKMEPKFIDEFLKEMNLWCNFVTMTHRADYDILKDLIDSTTIRLNEILSKYKDKPKENK